MSETAEWGNVCSRVDTCALTGAAAFFTGIKGAEVLVNGPLWCYFYALRHLEKSNYLCKPKLKCFFCFNCCYNVFSFL